MCVASFLIIYIHLVSAVLYIIYYFVVLLLPERSITSIVKCVLLLIRDVILLALVLSYSEYIPESTGKCSIIVEGVLSWKH